VADTDTKTTVVVDLDDAGYIKKLNALPDTTSKAAKSIEESGNKSKITFSDVGIALIAVNQGIELVHKAFEQFEELVKNAEMASHIKNVSVAYDALAKDVGVTSSALMASIQSATKGSISQLEAMRMSAYALQNDVRADAIPRMLELAETFEKIDLRGRSTEQIFETMIHSLSTGMFRSLKDFGINLKDTGDKQANLTNLIEAGERRVSSFAGSLDGTGEKFKSFKALMEDMANSMKVKMLPTANAVIDTLTQWGIAAGDLLGLTDASSSVNKLRMIEAETSKLKRSILSMREELSAVKPDTGLIASGKALMTGKSPEEVADERRVELKKRIEEAEKSLQAWEKRGQIVHEEVAKSDEVLSNAKVIRVMSNHEMQMAVLNAETAAIRANITDQEQQRSMFFAKEQSKIEEEAAWRLEQAKQEQTNHIISKQEFESRIREIESARFRQTQALRNQQELEERQSIMRSYTTWAGFSNSTTEAFKNRMKQIQSAGTIAVNGLMNGFNGFFESLGSGADDAAGQFGAAMLGMIGDIAVSYGEMMMLMGIFPPNPAAIAGGIALMALGSFVKGLSHRSKTSATPSGGGAAASGDVNIPNVKNDNVPMVQAEKVQDKKSATIVIQGDYLNTVETGQRLAQIVRQASDVTDFHITALGGGVA